MSAIINVSQVLLTTSNLVYFAVVNVANASVFSGTTKAQLHVSTVFVNTGGFNPVLNVSQVRADALLQVPVVWVYKSGAWVPGAINVYHSGVWVPDYIAPTPITPDPTAMTTDLPTGYIETFAQDFNTPISVGGFYPATSGDLETINSAASAYAVYGNGTDPIKIKNGLIPGQSCYYRPIETMSVANSVLKIQQKFSTTDNQRVGAAIIPILDGPTTNMTYGIVEFRMRMLGTAAGWWTIAKLFNTNGLTNQGEFHWPEGDNLNNPPGGSVYYLNESGGIQPVIAAGVNYGQWHIWKYIWTAGRIMLLCDNSVVLNSTNQISVSPLEFLIEASAPNSPTTGTSGSVEIDWIRVLEPA